MKIIKISVGERPLVKEIDEGLKPMQREVGGLIEMILLDNDIALICNEEGKLSGMPINRPLIIDGRIIDFIAGDFFLCYAPPKSEEFESIPDFMIDTLIERFS